MLVRIKPGMELQEVSSAEACAGAVERAVNLEVKLVFSDPEFEVYRLGAWEFTRCANGESFWIFVGPDALKEAQWQASPTKESLIQALSKLSKRSAAL